jgi:hypothetical protein
MDLRYHRARRRPVTATSPSTPRQLHVSCHIGLLHHPNAIVGAGSHTHGLGQVGLPNACCPCSFRRNVNLHPSVQVEHSLCHLDGILSLSSQYEKRSSLKPFPLWPAFEALPKEMNGAKSRFRSLPTETPFHESETGKTREFTPHTPRRFRQCAFSGAGPEEISRPPKKSFL